MMKWAMKNVPNRESYLPRYLGTTAVCIMHLSVNTEASWKPTSKIAKVCIIILCMHVITYIVYTCTYNIATIKKHLKGFSSPSSNSHVCTVNVAS